MADTSDIDRDDVHYIVEGTGPDGKLQEGDDLKKHVKKTLADYLSCLSKEKKNEQTIKSGLNETSIKDSDGNPAGINPSSPGTDNPFASLSDNPGLTNYSDSGLIFKPSVSEVIKKGEDGHSYAKDKSSKAFTAVSDVLKNNRFSPGPDNQFIRDGRVPNVLGAIQTEIGSYRSQGPEVEMDELQKVGFSLMLRAAGEIKAATEGDPFKVGSGVGAASLIPGKAQLALIKVDTNELRAKNAFGSFEKPSNDDLVNSNQKSWGVLNTPLEPFDGFLPIGMTILGVALTVGLTLVAKGFVGLLGLMIKPKADINFAPTHGPFIAGQFGRPEPPGKIFSLRSIGINSTDRDFIQCVNEGINVFFGFNGTSFKRVIQNPGFYTVFARNVIRSGNVIINDIKDVFTSNLNPIGAAQDFLGVVDTLKSSKIVAFLNIMAQIGDRSLELKGTGLNGKRISTVENLPENPATRQMKTRVSRSDIRQTTRTSAVPSKFLFSPEALKASDILSNVGSTRVDQAMAGLADQVAAENELIGNRISSEVVEKLEAQLDSEYVPFYFHDLRTNEIVAFHAFLESLEDTYTPNYERDGTMYGRVDPVMTYSNTDRNIQFSFLVYATSKSDFDVMWWKVNKLITLLYPQWSEGRQVQSIEDQVSFIQPFSQIPMAQPFIRIRIGDLIKSNYSKFNLARLFGLGSSKSESLSAGISPNSKLVISVAKSIKERMLKNPAVYDPNKSGYFVGEKAMLLPKHGGYNEAKDSLPSLAARVFRTGEGKKLITPCALKVKIVKAPSTNPGLIQDYGEHKIAYYVVEVDGVSGQSDDMKGQFLCTFTDLYPDVKTIAGLARGTDEDVSEELLIATTFFESDENAIARSFKTVQGKGLAGFITNFSMTEMAGSPTALWETTEYNSRAPKILKIFVQFTPIHDIPPGIDSSGFNRAVVYPVGNIAAKVAGEVDDGRGDGEGQFNKNNAAAFSPFKSSKGDKT